MKKDSTLSKILKSSRGFSLIEILIALTLIAIAGTFVTTSLIDSLNEGRKNAASTQIKNFSTLIKEFRRKCFFYPTTDQGLDSLMNKPSGKECKDYPPNGFLGDDVEEIPLDPWNNDYEYTSDGKSYNICSLGEDGEEGGEGAASDICLKKKGAN